MSLIIELLFTKKLRESKDSATTSGVALQFVFWIFIAVFLTAYVGSSVSYRVVEILRGNEDDAVLSINSISDLASQDQVRFGAIRAGSTFDYFKVSPDRLHRKIYSIMNRDKVSLPGTIEEGVSRVRYGTSPFAFIMEYPYAAYQTTVKPCNVVMAPNYFGPKKAFAVASRPGYWLRGQINSAILTMKENGELDELEAKWMQRTNDCESETISKGEDQRSYTEVTVENFLGIACIVPIAFIFSLIATAIELILARTKIKDNTNQARQMMQMQVHD